jgi:hypothetical protein
VKEGRDDSTSDRSNLSLKLVLSTVVFQLLRHYRISTKPTGFGTRFLTDNRQTGNLKRISQPRRDENEGVLGRHHWLRKFPLTVL